MDQRFHPAKNKSKKFILLKHVYSTRLNKSSKHAKVSAIDINLQDNDFQHNDNQHNIKNAW